MSHSMQVLNLIYVIHIMGAIRDGEKGIEMVFKDAWMLKLNQSEFNEFEPRLKSTKNRFELNLSAGLYLETSIQF